MIQVDPLLDHVLAVLREVSKMLDVTVLVIMTRVVIDPRGRPRTSLPEKVAPVRDPGIRPAHIEKTS
jgi:hypothetical protein